MTYDGKLYGLPYYADTTSFLYNANLLEDAGISAPPTTWEEVEEQANKLKENGIAVPIALEFAQAMPTTLENFTAMVFGRGGELLDENLDPILDDPAGAAYAQLTWLANMNKAGLVALLPHETDVVKAMNTGQHAFTVLYNYNLAELNNAATSPLAGQFKLGIMPGGSGQTYGFAKFYSMTKMAVDRGQEAMDAAWKFIEYFGGEVDGQFGVAKGWAVEKGLGFGQLPLFDDPDVQASFSQWVDVDVLKEQCSNARGRHQGTWYGIWAEVVRLELVRAVSGETTVDEALANAAQSARDLKQQFS
jgi:multiple sugar transport system substrate-binding protein